MARPHVSPTNLFFSFVCVAILLGHLKLPFDQIKEAILSCDDSVLSEQHLRQMEAFAPDKKEASH